GVVPGGRQHVRQRFRQHVRQHVRQHGRGRCWRCGAGKPAVTLDGAPLRRAFAVWGVALLVYVLAVFHRSSLAVAGLVATERFGISASQLASFAMLQLLVYAAMQIPVGLMLDRFGPRRVLITGLATLTVAQVGFAFAQSYPAALAARVLVGIGDAMIFVCVLRLVTSWFAP